MNCLLILEELMTHYQTKLYISKIQITSLEPNQAKTFRVNENLLGRIIYLCLYALSMVMKHSKFLTNIDVYTNFNPEIWRQSSTISGPKQRCEFSMNYLWLHWLTNKSYVC